MLNSVTLTGRLVRNPELRKTNSGVSVASFSLAVERDFSAGSGEKETDFIECVAWRGTAEFICKHFAKGAMMCVSGRLEVQSYKDRDGNSRKTTQVNVADVYFCEGRKREGAEAGGSNKSTAKPSQSRMSDTQRQYADMDDDDDDECPF